MEDVTLHNARQPLVLEQVEAALVEHLKGAVSGQCHVAAFPNDPGKFDFANLPAALLVHYASSQYDRHAQLQTKQNRHMRFALVLLCRSLRGEGGAYNHLEDARLAVQGNSFAGAGPAEIVSDKLEEEQDGVWRWIITISLPIPAVARAIQQPAPFMRPAFTTQILPPQKP